MRRKVLKIKKSSGGEIRNTMLPRSLFLIIVASCWVQINAVPFHSRNDYQSPGEEDVMDFAFSDSKGVPNKKESLLDNVENTVNAMEKLGMLKDRDNINLNANSPRKKKLRNRVRIPVRKRKVPNNPAQNGNKKILIKKKPNKKKLGTTENQTKFVQNKIQQRKKNMTIGNDKIKRSTGQLHEEIQQDWNEINKQKRESNKKSRNHCANSRRTINPNSSGTINMNSSYLNIDEDFTTKNQAKMKKIHTVFTDDYITLCWIETTVIKEDRSFDPPKRMALRDFTVTFENAASVPDEYLSCPIIEGDVTMESHEFLCNTSFVEEVHEDTQFSRTINITKTSREKNLYVQTNKIIKCSMGPVITKDVYNWINDTESARQRVEIKVSPLTYKTQEVCGKPDLHDESVECSDESEQEQSTGSEKINDVTKCYGKNCPDVIHQQTTIPTYVTEIEDLLTTESLTVMETHDVPTDYTRIGFVTEPTIQEPTEENIEPSQEKIPSVNETIHQVNKNITDSSEESCEDSCEDSVSEKSDESSEEIEKVPVEHHETNKTLNLKKVPGEIEDEKNLLYIPKPFNCPYQDEKICAHLEKVAREQSSTQNSEESASKSEESMSTSEISTNEEKPNESNETGVENSLITVANQPTLMPDDLLYTPSAITTTEFSTDELLETTTVKQLLKTIDKSVSQESEQSSSSENEASSTGQDNSWESLPVDTMQLLNHTQNIQDLSESREIESMSIKSDESTELNTMFNKSCSESGNCKPNATNILRNVLPMTQTNIQMKNNTENIANDEQEDSGSCDCSEESGESKKCDPITGACPPDNQTPGESSINEISKVQILRNASAPVEEMSTEVSTEMETSEQKSTEKSPTHKLTLKIHVSLEHIDENKESHKLAQIEKDLTLNELPSEHGNHSLYWQLQAFNNSVIDINSLKEMFNCTSVAKLTEDKILDELQEANLNADSYEDDTDDENSFHSRKRRDIENITSSSDANKINETKINSTAIKEIILANIRQDIKDGLHVTLSRLSSAIDDKINAEMGNINLTTVQKTVQSDAEKTESKNSSVINRNRRSMRNKYDNDEELSRWTNVRLTPSSNGRQYRSLTEMKILENSGGN